MSATKDLIKGALSLLKDESEDSAKGIEKKQELPDWVKPGVQLVHLTNYLESGQAKLNEPYSGTVRSEVYESWPAVIHEVNNGLITVISAKNSNTVKGEHKPTFLLLSAKDCVRTRSEFGLDADPKLFISEGSYGQHKVWLVPCFAFSRPIWKRGTSPETVVLTRPGWQTANRLTEWNGLSLMGMLGFIGGGIAGTLASMGTSPEVGVGVSLAAPVLTMAGNMMRNKRLQLQEKRLAESVRKWRNSQANLCSEHLPECLETQAELQRLQAKRESVSLGYDELKANADYGKLDKSFMADSLEAVVAKRNAVLYSEHGLYEEYAEQLRDLDLSIRLLTERIQKCLHFAHVSVPEWRD